MTVTQVLSPKAELQDKTVPHSDAENFTQSLASHQQPPTPHHQQYSYNTQQYPHLQIEQRPIQFMSDSNQCTEDEEHGEFSPTSAHRRAKRSIPDLEKDEKYWEKRKRNNLAAKRSRENKRSLEHDIRYKVSFLEEENALLRKEIFSIKNRFGLPLEQSVLTPEEREQCMLEVKHSPKIAEARSRRDSSDLSSISPNVSQTSLLRLNEESAGNHRESSDNSNGSPRVEEESSRTGPTYGPSTYGPFQPSPSWPAASPVGFPGLYANFSVQNYPSFPGQSKSFPVGNADTDRSSTPYSCYFNRDNIPVNRNIGSFMPSYDYYVQLSNQRSQMMYGNYSEGTSADLAPADLSTSRSRSQTVIRHESVERGDRVMISRKNNACAVGSRLSQPNGQSLIRCDLNDSFPGQAHIQQDQFCSELKLPTQINTSFSAIESNSTVTTPGVEVNCLKSPALKNLRRENETIETIVSSLSAQAELASNQHYIN